MMVSEKKKKKKKKPKGLSSQQLWGIISNLTVAIPERLFVTYEAKENCFF